LGSPYSLLLIRQPHFWARQNGQILEVKTAKAKIKTKQNKTGKKKQRKFHAVNNTGYIAVHCCEAKQHHYVQSVLLSELHWPRTL
jgi:hypothetical protein